MSTDNELIYCEKRKILASDADIHQTLRMSTLMKFLQEISISHTEALGCTKEKTLDRGLLWVVSGVRFRMKRPIHYDEVIRIQSWPGKMRHVLFPRYYRIFAEDGELILNGSAIWFLIDGVKRTFLFPKKYGIEIPGISIADEMELPEEMPSLDKNVSRTRDVNGSQPDKQKQEIRQYLRKVRYSDLDLNGHVNNTRYLDWIDDLHDPTWHKTHVPKIFQINFRKEIRPESIVRIRWRDDQEGHFLKAEGSVEGAVSFSAEAKF